MFCSVEKSLGSGLKTLGTPPHQGDLKVVIIVEVDHRLRYLYQCRAVSCNRVAVGAGSASRSGRPIAESSHLPPCV